LFFAYQGTSVDSRLLIDTAIDKGASAILVDTDSESIPLSFRGSMPIFSIPHLTQQISAIAARFYHYPAQSMEIIGVTGTNGKTSCTYFLASALHS